MTSKEPPIAARLDAKIDLADGVAIFRFALDRDFSFSPGQYATLWLTHLGKTIPRPYSIASAPSQRRCLRFAQQSALLGYLPHVIQKLAGRSVQIPKGASPFKNLA